MAREASLVINYTSDLTKARADFEKYVSDVESREIRLRYSGGAGPAVANPATFANPGGSMVAGEGGSALGQLNAANVARVTGDSLQMQNGVAGAQHGGISRSTSAEDLPPDVAAVAMATNASLQRLNIPTVAPADGQHRDPITPLDRLQNRVQDARDALDRLGADSPDRAAYQRQYDDLLAQQEIAFGRASEPRFGRRDPVAGATALDRLQDRMGEARQALDRNRGGAQEDAFNRQYNDLYNQAAEAGLVEGPQLPPEEGGHAGMGFGRGQLGHILLSQISPHAAMLSYGAQHLYQASPAIQGAVQPVIAAAGQAVTGVLGGTAQAGATTAAGMGAPAGAAGLVGGALAGAATAGVAYLGYEMVKSVAQSVKLANAEYAGMVRGRSVQLGLESQAYEERITFADTIAGDIGRTSERWLGMRPTFRTRHETERDKALQEEADYNYRGQLYSDYSAQHRFNADTAAVGQGDYAAGIINQRESDTERNIALQQKIRDINDSGLSPEMKKAAVAAAMQANTAADSLSKRQIEHLGYQTDTSIGASGIIVSSGGGGQAAAGVYARDRDIDEKLDAAKEAHDSGRLSDDEYNKQTADLTGQRAAARAEFGRGTRSMEQHTWATMASGDRQFFAAGIKENEASRSDELSAIGSTGDASADAQSGLTERIAKINQKYDALNDAAKKAADFASRMGTVMASGATWSAALSGSGQNLAAGNMQTYTGLQTQLASLDTSDPNYQQNYANAVAQANAQYTASAGQFVMGNQRDAIGMTGATRTTGLSVAGFSRAAAVESANSRYAQSMIGFDWGTPGATRDAAMQSYQAIYGQYQQGIAQADLGEKQAGIASSANFQSAMLSANRQPLQAQLRQLRGQFDAQTAGMNVLSPEYARAAANYFGQHAELMRQDQDGKRITEIGQTYEGRGLDRGLSAYQSGHAINQVAMEADSVTGSTMQHVAQLEASGDWAGAARERTLGGKRLEMLGAQYSSAFHGEQVDLRSMRIGGMSAQDPNEVFEAIAQGQKDVAHGEALRGDGAGGGRGGDINPKDITGGMTIQQFFTNLGTLLKNAEGN